MIIYGTGFYFKTDIEVRRGICPICKRNANLTSFVGTKCFTLYFIPVIPLGKMRVTDQCSSCRRGYVLDFKKWEATRHSGVTAGLEKLRSNSTWEEAVAAHRRTLQAGEFDRAAGMRNEAERSFPHNAAMLASFGEAIEEFQDKGVAQPYYEKAFQLNSELPAARIGLAKCLMATGQLDRARSLLSFMTAPGAEAQNYDMAPLQQLGQAYQNEGRHREALDIFQSVMLGRHDAEPNLNQPGFDPHSNQPEIPNLNHYDAGPSLNLPASNPTLQTSQYPVANEGATEHRLPPPPPPRHSGPPPPPPSFRKTKASSGSYTKFYVLTALAVVIVIVSVTYRLYYVGSHRRLYIVNGFDKPATVVVDGQTFTVQPSVPLLVVTPEGSKTIQVQSPIEATYSVDLTFGSWLQRLADSQETVCNIGGEAIIELVRIHYVIKGQPEIPTEHEFITGQPLGVYQSIDYPFVPVPTEIEDHSHGTDTVKLALTLGDQADYIDSLESQNKMAELLSYEEHRLQAHPDDTELLDAYANNGSGDQVQRVKSFLTTHLPFDPVSIPWHRKYQDLASVAERVDLKARYDQELLKYPNDSDLLYLRSRLAYDLSDEKFLLTRSLAANPKNPWALHSAAYACEVEGDWAGAEDREKQAITASGNESSSAAGMFKTSLLYILISENKTGEAKTLINTELKDDPDGFNLVEALMMCLSKEGNYDGVIDLQNRELQAIQNATDAPATSKQALISDLTLSTDYLTKNFAKLERDSDPKTDALTHYMALVAQKKWDQVRATPLPGDFDSDYASALLCSTAARADGQMDLAGTLFNSVLSALGKKGDEKKLQISVLQSATPPPQADVDNLNEDPEGKAAFLLALAYLHPELMHDYCVAAQQVHALPTLAYAVADPLISTK